MTCKPVPTSGQRGPSITGMLDSHGITRQYVPLKVQAKVSEEKDVDEVEVEESERMKAKSSRTLENPEIKKYVFF